MIKLKGFIIGLLVVISMISGVLQTTEFSSYEVNITKPTYTNLPQNEENAIGTRVNIVVDDDGGQDHRTIQAAINAANTGDTIYVYAGTYNENIEIAKTLSLIGNGSANTIIDGGGNGDVMHITANGVEISGFNLTNSGMTVFPDWASGIDIRGDDSHIEACILYDNDCGIYLSSSNRNLLNNNTCFENQQGIYSYNSYNNGLTNNTCIENNVAGINLDNSDRNTLNNNTCNLNDFVGICLSDSDSNILNNNTCNSMDEWGLFDEYGILLDVSNYNMLNNNTCNDNDYGIYLRDSSSNTLYNNSLESCGVYISGSSIENWNTQNIPTSNTVTGKPVYYWKDITGGRVPNGAGQVILANCADIVIENQNLSDGTIGVQLGFSDSNTINNNICNSNTKSGIFIWNSNTNMLNNNTCNDNDELGIYLNDADRNTLENNTCNDNDCGTLLETSYSNTLSNNTCNDNTDDGIYLYYSDRNILNTNTCNYDQNAIHLGTSNNNTLNNNTCNDNTKKGISLFECNDNILSNNMLDKNGRAILLEESNNNILHYNVCNKNRYSIYLDYSDGNTLNNNMCNSNENSGISLYGSKVNTVSNNTCNLNNDFGINLGIWSNSNTIINNLLENNTIGGITCRPGSSDNIIYQNYFINNNGGGIQANDDSQNNKWYGSNNHGNFWSDYSNRYPDANHDGHVWDIPYSIPGLLGNSDSYPLVPFNDNSPKSGTTGDPYIIKFTTLNHFNALTSVVTWLHGNNSGTDVHPDNDGKGTWNLNITLDQSLNDLTYSIHVSDICGNNVRNVTVYVPVTDNDNPSLDYDNSPNTGTKDFKYFFNISASDNVKVSSVNATWSHGNLGGNDAMYNDDDGTWRLNITLSHTLNDLIYSIQVNDTSGNYVRSETVTVPVSNIENPWFDLKTNPSSGTTGDTYSFDISISDNTIVSSANVTWLHGNLGGNVALNNDGDGTWSLNITLDHSLSDLTYSIQVNDTYGNYIRSVTINVPVLDNDNPSLDFDNSQSSGTTGDLFTFDISVSDNIDVLRINVSWSHGDLGSNIAMVDDGDGKWKFSIKLDHSLDELIYYIQVNDTSNNYVRNAPVAVSVLDNDVPIANPGEYEVIDRGDKITFDGSGSIDNTDVVNYTWTFTDIHVQRLYGANPTYEFANVGKFSVTLIVTDISGNSDEFTFDVKVFPNEEDKQPEETEETGEGLSTNAVIGIMLSAIIGVILLILLLVRVVFKNLKVKDELRDEAILLEDENEQRVEVIGEEVESDKDGKIED